MSHEEDYATNIDEQLLTAVKNQVSDHELAPHNAKTKLEERDHLGGEVNHNLVGHRHMDQRAAQEREHQQALYHQQQHMHDVGESEYNIQIPEPIIDSRSKIFPVNENTITNEGNLITRPFPEQLFHGREELNEFIAEFARDNGFGIVIAHSNRKAIYYTCELGGRYRHKKGKSSVQQQEEEAAAAAAQLNNQTGDFQLDQHNRSKKLRCPFSMTASFRKSTSIWSLRTTCNEHNHPQLDPLSNHPMLRKRSEELNLLILDLYKVGTKPSHIESKIKHQFPDVLIKREDIYNEIRGYKRKLRKSNKLFPPDIGVNGTKKRHTAASYHQVMADDDDDDDDEVLTYELERHRQEAELQRELQAAESHSSHHHDINCHPHHSHLDEQQLHHYQQQLSAHGLHDTEHHDSTAAAAIAAVAHAAHAAHAGHVSDNTALSIDNIDSRLVGE